MRLFLALIVMLLIVISCSNKQEPSQEVLDTGKEVFKTYCIVCHGADGKMGLNGAKDLTLSPLTYEEKVQVITKGRNTMAAYEGVLTEEQIKAVAAHVQGLKPE